MFKKQYEMVDGPKGLSLEEYLQGLFERFVELLEESSDKEDVFQSFFEENPICMPGAFELLGVSGHNPHNSTLICQPKIGNLTSSRMPDFMWLSQDSTDFCPVLIEIESPDKKLFTKGKQQTAEFSQALGQIQEWKALFNKPTTVMDFYEYYDIPDYLRKKNFKPQYCLIYGRRNEFVDDEFLSRKKAQIAEDDVDLMSYDRVRDMIPNSKGDTLLSCRVKDKRYEVLHIPPVYKYRPGWASDLCLLKNFKEKIDQMKLVSGERKQFLKDRYPYWVEYGKRSNQGIIHMSDAE